MPRTYVDNAYNRSVGRVGMAHGTAVISSSNRSSTNYNFGSGSGSSSSCQSPNYSTNYQTPNYTDSYISYTGASYSSPKTYVDNNYNQRIGRVGLPIGSAVVSSNHEKSASSYLSTCSSKTYVDNSLNRSLGRVGLPHGSAVFSKSNSNTSFLLSTKETNRIPIGETSNKYVSGSGKRLYVDNTLNRRLGRVGEPIGSMSSGSSSAFTADSPKYRGQTFLHDMFDHLSNNPENEVDLSNIDKTITEEQQSNAIDKVLDYFSRVMEVRKWQAESSSDYNPKTSKQLLEKSSVPIIKYEDIEVRGIIGRGTYGDVHFAKYKGSIIAVKKLRVQRVSKKRLNAFRDEVSVLCELQHPNVVRFLGACIITPNLCICMEYMTKTLHQALHMDCIEFSEADKAFIIIQIGLGMKYLHAKDVVHCDIKSQNILIEHGNDSPCVAKLTDFGLSMMKNNADTTTSKIEDVRGNLGTPRYSAPEVLRGDLLNLRNWKKADIYSLSLVIFEIACDEEPFESLSQLQLTKQVGENNLTVTIPRDVTLKPTFQILLKKCWARDAALRPTAGDIVKHMHEDDKIYLA